MHWYYKDEPPLPAQTCRNVPVHLLWHKELKWHISGLGSESHGGGGQAPYSSQMVNRGHWEMALKGGEGFLAEGLEAKGATGAPCSRDGEGRGLGEGVSPSAGSAHEACGS